MSGPLQGLKVIELAGLGPAPFCGMLLADQGAQVLRIERPGFTDDGTPPVQPPARFDVLARGRRRLALDLRQADAVAALLDVIAHADVLIEGFRPGVMERLGLGPQPCLARRPALIYGRMTGWGQHGPLAQAAGHDINYIAISGALHGIGRAGQPPTVPLNLLGDFGGGGMLLAFGVMCALHEARVSGRGQVVDAAMSDGSALLAAMIHGFKAAGLWSNERAGNLLDGAAHFYDTYACADGRFVAIGAIEPRFYATLLARCGIDDPAFKAQFDRAAWPALTEKLAALMRTRTRAQWCELLEGSDACFAPVLDWEEAPAHAHNAARETFITVGGITQPAPAPRFSRTPAARPEPALACGEQVAPLLRAWGVAEPVVARLGASPPA